MSNDKPTYQELEQEVEQLRFRLKQKEEECRFFGYFEDNSAIMLMVDSQSKKIFNVNNAAVDFYQYTKADFLQKTIYEIQTITPDEVDEKMKQAVAKKSNIFEQKHRTANNEIKDVLVFASPMKIGENIYMIVTVIDISDQKQLEKELNQSKIEYESIFEAIGHPTIILDENQNIIKANKATQIFTQKNEDEINKLKCFNLFHKSGNTPHDCPFKKSIKEKQLCISEMEIEVLNGYYLISCTPVYDIREKLKYVIHIATDITKTKEAERDLIKAKRKAEEGEKYNQMLFDSLPIGLALAKINGDLIYINKAYSDIIGYTIDEILKLTYWDITPAKYSEQEKTQLESLNKYGFYGPYEKEYIHKSGNLVPVRLTGRIVKKENENYIWSCVENISEKITYEKELIAAKEKAEKIQSNIKSIIENTSDSIWSINSNLELIYINKTFRNNFYASFNIWLNIGDVIIDKLPAPLQHEWNQYYKKAFNKESFKFENSIEFNGKNTYVEVAVNPIISNDKVIGISFFGRDITQQKNNEIDLIIAKEKAEESDRLKTAFLQNMSHEIRTPLNAIAGFSGFLNRTGLSDEKRRNFVSIIQNSSNQLISIVSDILTISSLETKQEKINLSNVCINNIILELLAIFKQQAINQNISLYAKQQLTDIQAEIYTDKPKISQVLHNLLSNALKFTHVGFVEFGYVLLNNEIEFYVKDTGIGIKPELHEKIFERFRQADKSIQLNYGGTGLGLSICKGFVELLGGNIRVKSEPGQGSVFYFTVPYKPVNIISTIKTTVMQNKNTKTIIVAEDEEYNFLFIEEIFIDMDVKLIHTKNGQETIDVFKLNQNIDLILMDIKMPGMTGDEAAKILKSIKPELPIIAQSAYALEHERAKYEGIFDDYLTKPINEDELKLKVMKYIKI